MFFAKYIDNWITGKSSIVAKRECVSSESVSISGRKRERERERKRERKIDRDTP